MHTTDPGRIEQLTAEGLWGNDTLHSLLAAVQASWFTPQQGVMCIQGFRCDCPERLCSV